MKNQQKQSKIEDFKIVSRPSNEEIEDGEEGSYRSKEEQAEEKAITQIDKGLSPGEEGFDEYYDRLEDK